MKITKHQIRKIIKESFVVPDHRRGFMGMGFGTKTNDYDPYARYRLNENEEDDPDTIEDAWAGGDNLVDPSDHDLEDNAGELNVVEPEVLELTVTERRLRMTIRKILSEKLR